MMMKLKDKTAIVTGGARGIGAAIVDRYVAEGARVAVADVNFAAAHETASRHGVKAFAVSLDVTKTTSIEAAVESVVARWGGIDILVNNAGIFDMGPIVEVTEESYEKVFAVNVKGLFFTLQAVARRMIARGQGGKIINMSSQAARRSAGRDLLRLEGGGHQPHAIGRPRPHQAPHQRQQHRAGRGRHADVGPRRFAVRQIRAPSARREEAARRSDCAIRSHGTARRLRRSRHVPRIVRQRLRRFADAERRWRKLDELTSQGGADVSRAVQSQGPGG